MDRGRHRLRRAMRFAELDDRVADAYRRMRHFAVRHIGTVRDDATERVLQKRDYRSRAAHVQERRHGVIPRGTRTDARLLPRLAPAAAEALHQLLLGNVFLM